MSVPIKINVGVVGEEPIKIGLKSPANTQPINVSAPIVIGHDIPEYDGPYAVTPSESVQTLETAEKSMTDDVTVGAIPSDYVGSEVHRQNSTNLTADGATVSVPSGYYAEDASKSIQTATPMPGLSQLVSPSTVTVNANGLVRAWVGNATWTVAPIRTAGYAPINFATTLSIVGGSKTLQLGTQAGATITPTESEQTAVAAKKYTIGDVKVAAIPSDYIGSEVPQKSSSDLSVSGATVTAPAGYYENAASASVPNATWKNASTVGVVPEISVDANGLVTANCAGWTSIHPLTDSGYADADTAANIQLSGVKTSQLPPQSAQTITPTESEQTAVGSGKYTTGEVKVSGIPTDYVGSGVTRKAAETYTPSSVAQEISAGQYLEGAQTIEAVAPPYYDMSGSMAWLGADATLVQTFTLADVKLSATDFATWTPSTTAADILVTRNAGSFTATDMPDYDYYVLWETKMPIVYLAGSTNKAKGLYLSAFHVQCIVRRASTYANLQAGVLNGNVNLSAFTGGNFYRYYNATLNNLTYTNNTSYGFYGTATGNALSSSTATSPTVMLKTPKVTARCSTTYLSTGNAALIDQTNTIISQKCTVYKVKAPSFMRGIWNNVMRMVQEIDPA